MKKKQKPMFKGKRPIDVQLRVPVYVLEFYMRVAALSRRTIDDVLNVVIAMDILRNTSGKEKAQP